MDRWTRGFHRIGIVASGAVTLCAAVAAGFIVVVSVGESRTEAATARCLIEYVRDRTYPKPLSEVLAVELSWDRKHCQGRPYAGSYTIAELREIADRSMAPMYGWAAMVFALCGLLGIATYGFFRLLGWIVTGFSKAA